MSEKVQTPPVIKRLNTNYVAGQDRFRLVAELEGGEVQALWLTQRMLRLALEPIAKYLHEAPQPSDRQKVRRSYVELMNKVSGKSGPPVATLEPTAEWLVGKLEIRFEDGRIHLLFKAGDTQAATMEMDVLKLRKWLGIVHRKSQKAGWPAGLWPDAVVSALE